MNEFDFSTFREEVSVYHPRLQLCVCLHEGPGETHAGSYRGEAVQL